MPAPVTRYAVLVLNNSFVPHLAAQVAGEIAARDWPVAGIGDIGGRLPQTTLYYSIGAEESGEQLARLFPQIAVVAPRPGWLLGDAELTLVVTRYWVEGG